MSNDVDLRELAVDRGAGQPTVGAPRRVLTRYVLPLVLILGFLSLLAWAAQDLILPRRAVKVMPVLATTAEIRQEGTPLFNAAGWIEPRPTPIRVAALAPGVVERLLVVEDQSVSAGEPIAELVRDDAKLVHDGALADLELRHAELEQAEAGLAAAATRLKQPVHLEAPLSVAAASLAKIETELKNLPFGLRRAEADHRALRKDYEGKLAAKGVVAGVEIDIAGEKAQAAQAMVEELSDRAESLRSERTALLQRRDALQTHLELLTDETKARDEAEAMVRAAKARVEQARVALAESKLQLDRMTVVAPVDGRIFRLVAHPGARIGGGMTQSQGRDGSTVVTMYRPELLQVRVDVRFEDIPKVSLDQPVEINNPALPSSLTGRVLFVSSEADIQKNTLQVKVAIPEPPKVFKPEMLVDVTFLAAPQANPPSGSTRELKLFAPEQLIQRGEGGAYIWLADQSEGVARKRSIETGASGANGLVEITSGVTPSSRVITEGFEGLRDGDRIEVIGEDATLGTDSTER